MKKFFTLFALALAPLFAQAMPQYLGGTFLTYFREGKYVDTPDVCNATHVQLQVTQDEALIEELWVQFRNGQMQKIPVRFLFNPNTSPTGVAISQWKDLNGNQRCISGFYIKGSSDFDYRSAFVSVYAYRGVPGRLPGMPSQPVLPGQRLLKQVQVSDFGTSTWVAFPRTCGLSQVMVQVVRDQVHIDYLGVQFGNGQIQNIPLRQRFANGSTSAWKMLNLGAGGKGRCLQGMLLSAFGDGDYRNAVVRLYGR
jgi:hypothetical protein